MVARRFIRLSSPKSGLAALKGTVQKSFILIRQYYEKNLLLLSDKINTVDFKEIQQRLMRTAVAKEMFLEVVSYRFESEKHNIPVNAAIAKANSMMHDMEIEILSNMVKSGSLDTDRMLIVDGPLQFLRQDTGKQNFSDLFYNVIGVSKSFNPMLPASGKSKRGGTQIGAELLKLEYGERTPVFMKENDRGRRFWSMVSKNTPQKQSI